MINPSTGNGAIAKTYTIKRGDDFRGGTFNFSGPAGEGSAFWDNNSVRAQWRASPDGELIYEHEFSVTVTESDGVGVLSFDLSAPATDTVSLPAGIMIGDIELKSGSLPKTTLVTMRALVIADVTHD